MPAENAVEEAIAVPTDANLQKIGGILNPSDQLLLQSHVAGRMSECSSGNLCKKIQKLESLQSLDLTVWAKLNLSSGSTSELTFPGLEIYPLSRIDLENIVAENGGAVVVGEHPKQVNDAYIRGSAGATQPQNFVIEVDEIRINGGDTLPYGFRINGFMPFTVLPSTSARMNAVRILIPNFAKYQDELIGAPIEFSLGIADNIEVAGWKFSKPWILVAKSIKDNQGRLIQHSVGLDILVATGGLRVTGDQRALFGTFNSTKCTGDLRWGSNQRALRYLISRRRTLEEWRLLVLSASRTLGASNFEEQYPLPKDASLLQSYSISGGGVDIRNMRYCPASDAKRLIKDGEIVQ